MKITSSRTTRPSSDPKSAEFPSKRQPTNENQPGQENQPDQNIPNKTLPISRPSSKPLESSESDKQTAKQIDTKRRLDEDEKIASKLLNDLANKKLTFLKASDVGPGNLVYFQYKAKGAEDDPEFVYDKTPFSFFIQSHQSTISSSKVLGINLHWLPKPLRKTIMNAIIKIGRNDIKRGKIPIIQYSTLKPILKNTGAMYAVRLYIKNRISSKGIVVPPDLFIKTAEHVPPEQITHGYSAEQIFSMALKRAKATKRKTGSRYRRSLH